jgi:hypothetical protein
MRKLSLRPYHGIVWLCDTTDEIRKAYKRVTKKPWDMDIDPNGGRYVLLERGDAISSRIWLVYAKDKPALAHEFAHVLLHTFKAIGHDPRDGDGEPFCYMLSQLMIEAA